MGSQLLEIGHVERAHGLNGETVVSLVTNLEGRLQAGSRFRTTLSGDGRELVVATCRPFRHRYLVQFEGVGSRPEAESLHGLTLYALARSEPGSMLVHELIGCEVFELDGTPRGRVAAVEANPASDILVGETGWLVPLRFVVEQTAGRIVVDCPAGMFE